MLSATKYAGRPRQALMLSATKYEGLDLPPERYEVFTSTVTFVGLVTTS